MADDDGSRKVILRSAGAHAFHMTRDDGVQAARANSERVQRLASALMGRP